MMTSDKESVPLGAADPLKDADHEHAKRAVQSLDRDAAPLALTGFADITLIVDRDGIVFSAEFGQDSTLARDMSAPVGRAFLDLLTRESHSKAVSLLQEATPLGLGKGREINILSVDAGPSIPLRLFAMQQGVHGDVLLVGRDLRGITDVQRQLVRLQQMVDVDAARCRDAELRFKAIFQSSRDSLILIEASSRRIIEANAAALSLFDLPSQRMSGRSLGSLFDERDGDRLVRLLAAVMAGQGTAEETVCAATGDKKLQVEASVFRQQDGPAILIRVTPEGQIRTESDGHASGLSAMIERLPDAFVMTDGEGRVLFANRAFLDLAELPVAEACVGHPLEQWLGRQTVEYGLMVATLREGGRLNAMSSVVRGLYGSAQSVELTGVRMADAVTERMAFLIRPQHRPEAVQVTAPVLARSADQMRQLVGSVPLKEIVREASELIERLCVEAALEISEDNRAGAADLLGLSRQSLYAKLHRYGLGDLSQSVGENTESSPQ